MPLSINLSNTVATQSSSYNNRYKRRVELASLLEQKKTRKFHGSREKEMAREKKKISSPEPRLGHPFNLRPIPNTVALAHVILSKRGPQKRRRGGN